MMNCDIEMSLDYCHDFRFIFLLISNGKEWILFISGYGLNTTIIVLQQE